MYVLLLMKVTFGPNQMVAWLPGGPAMWWEGVNLQDARLRGWISQWPVT